MSTAQSRGQEFERAFANYEAIQLEDDRIDIRVKRGSNDRGDISGIRLNGHRVVVECKRHKRMNLGAWVEEAHAEAGNDDAIIGVVVHKRWGNNKPGEQFVTMTVDDFNALILGGVK